MTEKKNNKAQLNQIEKLQQYYREETENNKKLLEQNKEQANLIEELQQKLSDANIGADLEKIENLKNEH